MAELRVTGLNDSMEMVVAVAQAGGCRIGEITAGLLRTVPRSLGSVWLRCSLTTARKINAVEGGKLRLGWTAARVHPLLTHRLQCFKYLEARHGATGAANQDIGPGTVRRGCLDVCYVQTWGCPRRIEWSYQHASRQPRKGRGDRKRESAATEEERRHLRRLAQWEKRESMESVGSSVRAGSVEAMEKESEQREWTFTSSRLAQDLMSRTRRTP